MIQALGEIISQVVKVYRRCSCGRVQVGCSSLLCCYFSAMYSLVFAVMVSAIVCRSLELWRSEVGNMQCQQFPRSCFDCQMMRSDLLVVFSCYRVFLRDRPNGKFVVFHALICVILKTDMFLAASSGRVLEIVQYFGIFV